MLIQTALGPLQDWCFRLQERACHELCQDVSNGHQWWGGQVPAFAQGNLIECLTRMVLAVDPDKGYVLTPAGKLFLETGVLPPLAGGADNYDVAFNTNQ